VNAVTTSEACLARRAERKRRIAVGLVAIGILVAAGWPGPRPPANEIRRPERHPETGRGGLEFRGWSQALGEEELWLAGPAISIELWLEPPSDPGVGNQEILSFVDEPGVRPFLLGQWPGGYLLRSRTANPRGEPKLDDYLRRAPTEVGHLAVTLSTASTRLFVDGLAQEAQKLGAILTPAGRFGGRLLLGNSNTGWGSWRGTIRALAFHERVLSAEEIREHAAFSFAPAALRKRESSAELRALYLFGEGTDETLDCVVGDAPALVFPERVTYPITEVLAFRWPGDASARWFIQDFLLNVLGFVPLGALLAWNRGGRGVAKALVVGASFSLSIEIAQIWISGRDSSCVDLVANSAGSLIGGGLACAIGRRTRAARSLEPES
jgi:hypothetical protein